MAKNKSLATMSFDALVKLRDDVTTALSSQAAAMQNQLQALGEWSGVSSPAKKRGRPPGTTSSLKGRKAKVKYRDKDGNHWSGRGAQPRWMTAAIKAGAKRDDFLVGKPGRPAKAAKVKKATAKKAKSAKKPKPVETAGKAKPGKKAARKPVVAPPPGPAPSSQA